jgi:hypothetical protein
MKSVPVRILVLLLFLVSALPTSSLAFRPASPPEGREAAAAPREVRKPDAGPGQTANAVPGRASAPERRTALVIGNSSYGSGPLKNPVHDAVALAAQLEKLGFSVILKKNADLRTMDEALAEFGDRLKRGGVGLFYFAGHGLQARGVNYLVPIGARISRESDIKYETMDAGRILDEMANANNGLNIVILDACRDNPYARSFRSAARGLAVVSSAPVGTFISYSTGPGGVARDGEGINSPYTQALLAYMSEPGLTIEQVFKAVRAKLGKETGGVQVPWELSSLEGEFYFVPSGQAARPAAAAGGASVPGETSVQLALAQQAFDEKKFAEPGGDNAIEYVKGILARDPGDAAALSLEKRAVAACENEAAFALSRNDEARAVAIYKRLFALYPEQKKYLDAFVNLEGTKALDISGTWRPEHVSGKVVISSDGRCVYRGFLVVTVTGTWSRTDVRQRKVAIVWSHGFTDYLTLSADGRRLEGVNNVGDPVSFVRDR